jgi:hypothetical protein
VVLLEFQRGGEYGPRVTGVGTTFDEAVQLGKRWMERYEEWDQRRLS